MATRPQAFQEMSKFWTKNRQLNRPLSPHVTVYKMHLTMLLSISNRITATALQAGLSLGGIAVIFGQGKYEDFLAALKASTLGPAVIFLTKFALAATFAVHFVSGSRHLVWDAGMWYSKPMTMQVSKAVAVLTIIMTLALMAYPVSKSN